jgi:hypothetical protein
MNAQIKLRNDTLANWASENPVLLSGEIGIETDTNKIKIGDGTTAWNSLAYFSSGGGISDAPSDGSYYGRLNAAWTNLKTYFDTLYSVLAHTHADVPTSRTITTTAPLRIDAGASADLSANRTLAIDVAAPNAAGVMSAADKTKLDGLSGGDGWVGAEGTWSYSSADAPTFVISVNKALDGIIGVGMRIKLTQTTAKYFIVTAVGTYSGGATLITVYGGTDYTLANAAITTPFWSSAKAPFGFPTAPEKWTVAFSDTSVRAKANPTQNTWYQIHAALQFYAPIGAWRVYQKYTLYVSGASPVSAWGTISTANNSESNSAFTVGAGFSSVDASIVVFNVTPLTVATKTLEYIILRTTKTGCTDIEFNNSASAMSINLVCAYL